MDGSQRKKIVTDNLTWPNGLTMDHPTDTIYWVDAKKHTIESVKTDGTKRRIVSFLKLELCFTGKLDNLIYENHVIIHVCSRFGNTSLIHMISQYLKTICTGQTGSLI